MSRMTKFLKQRCMYEQCKHNADGSVKLDTYGEPEYEAPVQIKCRKETSVQDVQTNTGAILKSSTRYFVDNKYTIEADDKLDGKPVFKVIEYINQFGKIEGFECYV